MNAKKKLQQQQEKEKELLKCSFGRIFCYDKNHAERLQHGATHGPHCFNGERLSPSIKKTISVSDLFWVIGTLVFSLFTLIYSLTQCSFYAWLFYFTHWGVIVSNLYFLDRAFGNLFNRYQQSYVCLLWDPKWNKTKIKNLKETPYKMPPLGIFLWGTTMQLQLVSFVWETCIFGLYWGGGGNDVSFDFMSICAHMVLPILIWIDIWASALPFPIEHVYKIPFYAAIYPLFGMIHYFNNWGHFTNNGVSCEAKYYNSLVLNENWVYSQFNFANDITYVYIFLMVCIVVVILGFIVYQLKKCTEEDDDDEDDII